MRNFIAKKKKMIIINPSKCRFLRKRIRFISNFPLQIQKKIFLLSGEFSLPSYVVSWRSLGHQFSHDFSSSTWVDLSKIKIVFGNHKARGLDSFKMRIWIQFQNYFFKPDTVVHNIASFRKYLPAKNHHWLLNCIVRYLKLLMVVSRSHEKI